jgi:predicted  nucleic acid-binding Zn-ribbon protein
MSNSSNPTQELQMLRSDTKKKESELAMEEAKLKKLEDEARNVTQHIGQLKTTITTAQQRERELEAELKSVIEKKKTT